MMSLGHNELTEGWVGEAAGLSMAQVKDCCLFSLETLVMTHEHDAVINCQQLRTWLFVLQFVHASIKENIKALHYWSFETYDRWIQRASNIKSGSMTSSIFHLYINTLWPNDTIWQQRSGSTLAQVMACSLTAPSHYLNQCWLIISEVQSHSY